MITVGKFTSLTAAYELHAQAFPRKARAVKTAIVRYLLPYPELKLDFKVFPHQPLARRQAARGLELAQELDIEIFSDVDRVLSWQEKVFITLNANPNTRAVFKSYLKHFLTWCQEQGLLKPKHFEAWSIPVSYPGLNRKHAPGDKKNYPITNRYVLVPYRLKLEQLSQSVQKEFREFEAFWMDPHYEGCRPTPGVVEEMTYDLCFRFILQLVMHP